MLRIVYPVVFFFIGTSFIYAQNDSTLFQEEDSIIYIKEDPLIIKKTIEVVLPKNSQKKWELILLGHVANSFFKDSYKTSSTGNDTYTSIVRNSLSGNFSLRWGGELMFLYRKIKSIGIKYDFGQMNQKYNYILPNGVDTKCHTFINHYYLLVNIGRRVFLSKRINFHPKLAVGSAILYQQVGLIPSIVNSYYDARYADYIKTKKVTPMLEIEAPIFYQYNKFIFIGVSPFINGNVMSYTTSESPFHMYRKNYGIRLVVGWKLI